MKTIELIASGYEFICPNCEEFNREIEAKEVVQCKECNETFKVDCAHHAFE